MLIFFQEEIEDSDDDDEEEQVNIDETKVKLSSQELWPHLSPLVTQINGALTSVNVNVKRLDKLACFKQ